jgi:serine/threonine protein kinase
MRLDSVPEEVPAEVAELMNECLDPDPKNRPSAKQIYDRLAATPGPAPRQRSHPSQPSGSVRGSDRHPPRAGSTSSNGPLDAESVAVAAATAATAAAAAPVPGRSANAGDTVANPLCSDTAAADAPPLKYPTPLGRTRLPIKSVFDTEDG